MEHERHQSKGAVPYSEKLTPTQHAVVAAPVGEGQRVFVHGPAGSGKTTALQRRLISLLAAGIPSYSVLILLPEFSAAEEYRAALGAAGLGPYSDLHLTTFSGLARELVTLFWPLLARSAGFAAAHRPPTFLSYDLAQVQMRRVVEPLRAEGAFEGLRMRPQQILSQLLDNLNRAALNELTLDEMEKRLIRSWGGDPRHVRYFERAAEAARLFRRSCLEANLLDLSLVIDLFSRHLLHHPVFFHYLVERYRHLLVDNLEEMSPAAAGFVRTLLPGRDSATLAYDDGGGYKRYLAADPEGAWLLSDVCDRILFMPQSLTTDRPLEALGRLVRRRLLGPAGLTYSGAAEAVVGVIKPRYRREMIQEAVSFVTGSLLSDASPSTQVAIIAPYLDGALLRGLTTELEHAGAGYRVLRRRSSPRDEPLVRAWLTLAALAHPGWSPAPSQYDVAEALAFAVSWLDRPRASLAARRLYDPAAPGLQPADTLSATDLARIGAPAVERVEELRRWLMLRPGGEPLDGFLACLFSDLLSTRRFRPQPDLRAAAACDWLVKAASRFRRVADASGLGELGQQAREFIASVYGGLVTGAPAFESGSGPARAASEVPVVIATLYAYLLTGPAVRFQVWLEASATGWWEIPRQPLSNAFVLTPSWDPARTWTEADSSTVRNQLLTRLVGGLCARCSQGVVLASSDLDRRGERQDGPLWRALDPVVSLWKSPSP